MVSFSIQPHSVLPGVQIVEILVDGVFAAAIYPFGEDGIRLVSTHVTKADCDEEFAARVLADAPCFFVSLDPSRVIIDGNVIG